MADLPDELVELMHQAISQAYMQFSSNGQRKLACSDVMAALQSIGLTPNTDQLNNVVTALDPYKKGVLEFSTFEKIAIRLIQLDMMNRQPNQQDAKTQRQIAVENTFLKFASGTRMLACENLRIALKFLNQNYFGGIPHGNLDVQIAGIEKEIQGEIGFEAFKKIVIRLYNVEIGK